MKTVERIVHAIRIILTLGLVYMVSREAGPWTAFAAFVVFLYIELEAIRTTQIQNLLKPKFSDFVKATVKGQDEEKSSGVVDVWTGKPKWDKSKWE